MESLADKALALADALNESAEALPDSKGDLPYGIRRAMPNCVLLLDARGDEIALLYTEGTYSTLAWTKRDNLAIIEREGWVRN